MSTVLKLFSYLKWWIIYRAEAYRIFDKKRDRYITVNETTKLYRPFREKEIASGRAKLVKGLEEKRKALSRQKIT